MSSESELSDSELSITSYSDDESSCFSEYSEDFKDDIDTPVYEELNQNDILNSIDIEVQDFISAADDVSEPRARFLLQSNQWDFILAFEALKTENKEKVTEKAEIQVDNPPINASSPTLDCDICFDSVPLKDTESLGCEHSFCKECLKESFIQNIRNRIVNIPCPGEECNYLLPSTFVKRILADEKSCSPYLRILSQSYIDNNKKTVWCPGTNCDLAFRSINFSDDFRVQCSKGHKSCFKCQKPWHEPLDCSMLKKWLKKCQDDSETANWIATNTKECPKCNASIEKNGGCNHITCISCRWHWCWLCFKEWGEHECEEVKESHDVSDQRAALDRYIHYFNLYTGHRSSLEFESKITMESIYERFEKLPEVNEVEVNNIQNDNNDNTDGENEQVYEANDRPANFQERCFIREACEALKEGRNTLMYSYVFCFYLKDGNKKQLLENLQKYLQTKVENLSEFLERDIHKLSDIKKCLNMKSIVEFCKTCSKSLIQAVQEDKLNNYWEFCD